jgi:hypothetical protein
MQCAGHQKRADLHRHIMRVIECLDTPFRAMDEREGGAEVGWALGRFRCTHPTICRVLDTTGQCLSSYKPPNSFSEPDTAHPQTPNSYFNIRVDGQRRRNYRSPYMMRVPVSRGTAAFLFPPTSNHKASCQPAGRTVDRVIAIKVTAVNREQTSVRLMI